jgi:hypothetical protein
MNWLASRIFWGILLVGGGLFFLLHNLGVIDVAAPFWAVIFGIAGLGFLSVFVTDRQNWWALIPGIILLSIGSIVYLSYVSPELSEQLGGVIILGGIGLSFLLIYLVDREHWWALIPAGVMATLATITGLSEVLTGFDMGGIFFLGLGLTFLIVSIVPTPQGQMKWALIPAGILLVMGLLILAALSAWLGYIWPAVLIALGLFLIYRTVRARA